MIDQIIWYARQHKCSDIHLSAGIPPVFRKNGKIFISQDAQHADINARLAILSMLSEEQRQQLETQQDLDFCYTLPMGERQRVNVYHQQGELCAAIRVLNETIPTMAELALPAAMEGLADLPSGLILVTGPTGSGKSTTLAAMINHINESRTGHIITMEDPVEYRHNHKNCLVHQREIGADTPDFAASLRSALREDPDVILVGEMRDLETISAAITAAETGHLVLSTLHTVGAANTLDRMIDVFPAAAQNQIRTQLASVLRGVITQQLVPLADGTGRVASFEVMLATDAVCNLIRENKCFQINSVLQTGLKSGMFSLNYDLARLVRNGQVDMQDALEKSTNRAELQQLVQTGIF